MGIRLAVDERGELRISPEALRALRLPVAAGATVYAERRGKEVVLSGDADWQETEEWVRTHLQAQAGGAAYDEDAPFLCGLTRQEFVGLSEQEQEELWNREHEKESERLDHDEEQDAPARFTAAGQRRRAPSPRRA